MDRIRVLAAGSLRLVWPELASAFEELHSVALETQFGPAGLLRRRIELGEPCHLFASANVGHPHALLASGKARHSARFCRNQLCLSVKAELDTDRSWLELLSDPALRVATSTPLSDPAGDYAWQLFDNIESHHAGVGSELKNRALQLVGGADSQAIPTGESAASWLLNSDLADIFIGYQSYAAEIQVRTNIRVITVPASYQIRADYEFAVCAACAQPLADFLLSKRAQMILQRAGFGPASG